MGFVEKKKKSHRDLKLQGCTVTAVFRNIVLHFTDGSILANGVEWYQNISKSKDAGTKLMGFSGRVKNPGLWELPFGTTAREISLNCWSGINEKHYPYSRNASADLASAR